MSSKPAHLPKSRLQEGSIDLLRGVFYRVISHLGVPARWFEPDLPSHQSVAAKTGYLNIEIVSHCWKYAHLLSLQLSSIVKYPPKKAGLTMTVFYSEEDQATKTVLNYFGDISVAGVTWNWVSLPRQSLFRRAIGRNYAALNSEADWIWFTDCDVLFRNSCLDSLAEALAGRRDFLVYPKTEYCTELLSDGDPMLNQQDNEPGIVDINQDRFQPFARDRATGPLQIVHGDVARACGYCNALGYYQEPASSWRKAYEDSAFRWLLRTEGTPIEIPGVYRIRHQNKGRYSGRARVGFLRSRVRRLRSWLNYQVS